MCSRCWVEIMIASLPPSGSQVNGTSAMLMVNFDPASAWSVLVFLTRMVLFAWRRDVLGLSFVELADSHCSSEDELDLSLMTNSISSSSDI